MNRDHALGAIGGGSAYIWLATVIQGMQGCGADMANAEAGLIVLALGVAFNLVQRYLPPAPLAPPA